LLQQSTHHQLASRTAHYHRLLQTFIQLLLAVCLLLLPMLLLLLLLLLLLVLPPGCSLELFPLHSSVDIDEAMQSMQQAVAAGSRKVILATNVAGDSSEQEALRCLKTCDMPAQPLHGVLVHC
jgi:HrpA-like RNA helicase